MNKVIQELFVGEDQAETIASAFIKTSRWFQLEPQPNDWWMITVKQESHHFLAEQMRKYDEQANRPYMEALDDTLTSTSSVVAQRAGKVLDALDMGLTNKVVRGPILNDMAQLHQRMLEQLRRDGWRIRPTSKGRWQVLPHVTGWVECGYFGERDKFMRVAHGRADTPSSPFYHLIWDEAQNIAEQKNLPRPYYWRSKNRNES